MKRLTFFLRGDRFVQRVECDQALVDGISMHEHTPEQSHLTNVIAGSIEILDGRGWSCILSVGETVNLDRYPQHAVQALEHGTIFENEYCAGSFRPGYVDSMIGREIVAESCLVLDPLCDKLNQVKQSHEAA